MLDVRPELATWKDVAAGWTTKKIETQTSDIEKQPEMHDNGGSSSNEPWRVPMRVVKKEKRLSANQRRAAARKQKGAK